MTVGVYALTGSDFISVSFKYIYFKPIVYQLVSTVICLSNIYMVLQMLHAECVDYWITVLLALTWTVRPTGGGSTVLAPLRVTQALNGLCP